MKQDHKYWLLVASVSAVIVAAILYLREAPTSIVYSIVAIAMIAAALENIVYDNDLIRDKYTLPGIAFGVVASAMVPSLQGEETLFRGALSSAFWAFVVYGGINLFNDLESRFSGPKVVELDRAVPFKWTRTTGAPMLFVGADLLLWGEVFYRKRDELRIECDTGSIDSEKISSVELVFKQDKLFVGARRYLLSEISDVRGTSSNFSFPKEALGGGIAKAVAAFAAIFGWQGALFVLFGSAIISTVLRFPLMRRKTTSTTVPLMPFLAAAAVLWMLFGEHVIAFYSRS